MKRLLIVVWVWLLCGLALAGTLQSGSKDVAAAGTAERLAASRTPAVWVIVQAKSGNTGTIFLGGAAVADGNGGELAAGDSVKLSRNTEFEDYDLYDIWVDTDSAGDGVVFLYFQR